MNKNFDELEMRMPYKTTTNAPHMLDIRATAGDLVALPYHFLEMVQYNPSDALMLTFAACEVRIEGRNTSRESVTNLENQKRRVPDLELFIIARILGVKMGSLFPRSIGGKLKEYYPQYRVKLSRGQIPRS